ncbi:hypothetical protein [Corynebacterium sp. HS2168-gen11]|uniref:hypothetical protein n=1 Tax=Corynebacterium sp. HS2168-gen11 TaxID=2974027 RepID=UPI00216B4D00|nr:hypothetical protein [Corynebacterium sp. HS2168-gen11]MCS4536234.1 hypothetical protein [Corynebacterium sp. HS2168-gen11]
MLRQSQQVRYWAQAVVVIVSLYSIGGVLWGILRPGYRVQRVSADQVAVVGGESVEFAGFASFVLATTILATVIVPMLFHSERVTHPRRFIVWLAGWSVIATIVFFIIGTWMTPLRSASEEVLEQAAQGEILTLLPSLHPQVGYFVVPGLAVVLMSMVAYSFERLAAMQPEQSAVRSEQQVGESAESAEDMRATSGDGSSSV